MDYRSLGRTGVMLSPLGLGAMNFGEPTAAEESIRIIHRALDAGINLIDTAKRWARQFALSHPARMRRFAAPTAN